MVRFIFPLQGLTDLNLTVYPLGGGDAIAGPTNFVDSGDPPGTYELTFTETLSGVLRCTISLGTTVINEFVYRFSGAGPYNLSHQKTLISYPAIVVAAKQ